MIYDLNKLNNNDILIDEEVFKDDKLDKRILDLKNTKVKGKIYIDNMNEIAIDIDFSGTMIINDSVSLDEVPYDFNVNINENLSSIKENYPNSYEISQNTLDLIEILWQNIVLEVPISYTQVSDMNMKGNGWELNKKVDNDEIDPRFKKLEDLLKGDD